MDNLLLLSIWFFVGVLADVDPDSQQYCVTGCQTALSLNTFSGTPSILDGYYVEECRNLLHVQSIYACARKYCEPADIQPGIAYLDEICQTYGYIDILGYDVISNLTDAGLNDLPTVIYGNVSMLDAITIPDRGLYGLGYRTIEVWYDQRTTHLTYSKAMFIFWGIVVAFGVLLRVTHVLHNPTALQRFWKRVQATLILAPTFTYSLDSPIGVIGTLPSRLESLVILAFIIINIVLCAVNYELFVDNLYYTETDIQLLRYVADRTGYLAYANLSIFWLFGIRNNILIWLTGWDFSVFNHFHRWVARVSTLEAVVHSIAYTVFSFKTGGIADYSESFLEQYWYTGVIATIAMSLLIGFSVRWLRVRYYDTFLLLHISLALIALVNLFYHTNIFLGQYDGFLWPCVALWVLDRVVRILRVLWNLARSQSATALITYDSDADIVRIDVTDVLCAYGRKNAGSHLFVYLPSNWKFWESHPFTLIRWKASSQSESASEYSETSKELAVNKTRPSSEEATLERFTLIIRPHKGFTAGLARRAIATEQDLRRNVLLEGPYGKPIKLHNQDLSQVLFVIGGSGISVAITALYDLLEQPSPPSIRLIWAMRGGALLTSILRRELHSVKSLIQIEAYITQDRGYDEKSLSTSQLVEHVQVHAERPNVRRLIAEAASAASGKLGVVACGPATMMNEVRVEVIEQLASNGTYIKVWLESFVW